MSTLTTSLNLSALGLQGFDLSKLKSGKATPEDVARLVEGLKQSTSFSAALTQEQAAEIAAALNAEAASNKNGTSLDDAQRRVDAALQALQAQKESARTYYNTQALGQDDEEAKKILLNDTETSVASGEIDASEQSDPIVEEFLKYMRMSPEERLLAQILGEEGMTIEEFNALSAADQQKILAKLRARIEEAIKQEQERQEQHSKNAVQASQSTQVFTDLRSGEKSNGEQQQGSGLFKDGKVSLVDVLDKASDDQAEARDAVNAEAQSQSAPPMPLGRRRRSAA